MPSQRERNREFDKDRGPLRAYRDELLTSDDYELAAEFGNSCRAAGVSGSAIDFLICAAAHRRNVAIFTSDRDFARYAAVLPVRLHSPMP